MVHDLVLALVFLAMIIAPALARHALRKRRKRHPLVLISAAGRAYVNRAPQRKLVASTPSQQKQKPLLKDRCRIRPRVRHRSFQSNLRLRILVNDARVEGPEKHVTLVNPHRPPQRHLLRNNLRQIRLHQPMLPRVELIHLARPVHAAELRPAHAAERRFLVVIIRQRLIVHPPSRIRIERQAQTAYPSQTCTVHARSHHRGPAPPADAAQHPPHEPQSCTR